MIGFVDFTGAGIVAGLRWIGVLDSGPWVQDAGLGARSAIASWCSGGSRTATRAFTDKLAMSIS